MEGIRNKDIYSLAFDTLYWESFYDDFASNEHVYNTDVKNLRKFIDEGKHLEVLKDYEKTGSFPIPKLLVLNKKGTDKKRTVFSFDEDISWLLKFYGYCLHAYDDIFSDNLYSFRKNRSVKTAVARILKQKDIHVSYGVKLDIHDYFNSADTDLILGKIEIVLKNQKKLLGLFENILRNPYVYPDRHTEKGAGSQHIDKNTEIDRNIKGDDIQNIGIKNNNDTVTGNIHKGMMAGNPLSSFMANLYLSDMDRHFEDTALFYARYSDDIILFTDSEDHLQNELLYINGFLDEHKLTINPDKVSYIYPGSSFEFLGFSFENDKVDVSKSSFEKIKKKLRRKSRAVLRWKIKKNTAPEKACTVFIRYFNRKFFENPVRSELTWCRWYFPVITTDVTIREIDHYMQECIRYIYTGKHTKKNYNLRYDELKKMGYRSLVNEYHKNT